MKPEGKLIAGLRAALPAAVRARLDLVAKKVADAKQKGQRVVVVTGSGPNIHEGVTTLIAELIHKGVVDGVITSSAVVGHEMAGALDRVKRVRIDDDNDLGIPGQLLPRGRVFEITCLSASQRQALQREVAEGWDLYDRLERMPGDIIIKAAGNVAWPMGLRTERLAREAEELAKQSGTTLEHVVGLGADPMTMIGAGAQHNVPVVVSVTQLVGGGAVGLALGDAISTSQRCRLVADLLERAEVIVESAIALSQEIHDGPFETYTGHGIWAAWTGVPTYSLEGKTLVRIDLDPNLELAWRREREASEVQRAVDRGLPKAKLTGIPFRMEMSGFARLEGSIPVTADIGVAWPIIAHSLEDALGIRLDFISAPQETEQGQQMRDWIADYIQYVDQGRMYAGAKDFFERCRKPAAPPRLSVPPGR
jgi:hypothetical protein